MADDPFVASAINRIRITQGLWVCAYTATAILAAWVVWVVGHRGVFLCDQSGMFDAAWRLVQGQVIYRDFYAPYPPVTFFIQSLFFRFAGVDFSSMVLAAAVVNALAAVCVMRIIRRLLPDSQFRPAALAGGIVTAVWFQAPFGTLWFEQTSFLFNLIALTLLVETAYSSDHASVYLRVIAGSSLALSILCKQNAGALLLPGPVGAAVILCAPHWRKMGRALLEISTGMLIVFALFFAWLVLFSSPSGFWHSTVVMSGDLAASRMRRLSPLTDILRVKKTWPYIRKAVGIIFIFAISRVAFRSQLSKINVAVICWVVLAFSFLQNIFSALTANEIEDTVSYLGLLYGTALGLCFPAIWKPKFAVHRGITFLGSALLLLVGTYYLVGTPTVDGWDVSSTRIVQQFDIKTRFTERVNVPGASRLVWGDPTLVGPYGPEGDSRIKLTRQDFENVNAWLSKANKNFFVFPDSTLLYGLHHKVSPQPWLYFFPGHSFRLADLPQMDGVILRDLRAKQVQVIVLEKISFLRNHELLSKLPQLEAWIHHGFEKTAEFGIYEIWTLR